MPVTRIEGSGDALIAIDATSAAGGLPVKGLEGPGEGSVFRRPVVLSVHQPPPG